MQKKMEDVKQRLFCLLEQMIIKLWEQSMLGGKLERIEIDPYDRILTSVYLISVDESLEKYKDEYVNFIDKSYENNFIK